MYLGPCLLRHRFYDSFVSFTLTYQSSFIVLRLLHRLKMAHYFPPSGGGYPHRQEGGGPCAGGGGSAAAGGRGQGGGHTGQGASQQRGFLGSTVNTQNVPSKVY